MNHSGRIVLFLGASSFLSLSLGCGNGADSRPHFLKQSSPIIGGTSDSSDNSVGLVYFEQGGQPQFICTATLISPNVFLTAGHCTVADDSCTPGNCSANPASGYFVYGGESPMDSSSWAITSPTWKATISAVHPDPNYNGQTLEGDVGILIASSVTAENGGTAPTPMPWLSSTDSSAYASGASFYSVGYGETDQNNQGTGVGTKRKVTLTSQGESGPDFAYGSSSKNTCSGDSGGPAIETINGTPTVIGTTSYGDQNCSQSGYDMRTDGVASFISQYANAAPTPTPTDTPTGTPTPNPTGTPGSNGNNNGGANGNGNGNGASMSDLPRSGGCDVAGAAGGALGLVPLLLPFGLALARRRRRG